MKMMWYMILEWGFNLKIKLECSQEMVLWPIMLLVFFRIVACILVFVRKQTEKEECLIPCVCFSRKVLSSSGCPEKKKKSFSLKQNGKNPAIPKVTMMKNKLRATAPNHRSSPLITSQSKGNTEFHLHMICL